MASEADELPSVSRRLAAGKMLSNGASNEEVAHALQIAPVTVGRYRKILETGGLDALRQMSTGGRPSVLDDGARQWLVKALSDSARAYGYESDIWTNSRVRALLASRFGVNFSRVYTWQLVTKLGVAHRLSKSAKSSR